jgi:hypothetical protein
MRAPPPEDMEGIDRDMPPDELIGCDSIRIGAGGAWDSILGLAIGLGARPSVRTGGATRAGGCGTEPGVTARAAAGELFAGETLASGERAACLIRFT